LSFVTDSFNEWMRKIKTGVVDIIDGGHTVIIGYTNHTCDVLEALAEVWKPQGGTNFALLDSRPKLEVEKMVAHADVKNSRIEVRSGRGDSRISLKSVAASSASVVMVLADTTTSREQADDKTIRVLLALKAFGFPKTGHIVAQCRMVANVPAMESICPEKTEVVVVSDLVTKSFAQSSLCTGLTQVFTTLLTVQNGQLHCINLPGLIGKTFQQATFLLPNAVLVGVALVDGTACLNPSATHRFARGERAVVYAEDPKAVQVLGKPYIDFTPLVLADGLPSKEMTTPRLSSARQEKVLIIGWNEGIGKLLCTLDHQVSPGTSVDVYSVRHVHERIEFVEMVQKRRKTSFRNIEVSHMQVHEHSQTSRYMLESLCVENYQRVFIIGDVESAGSCSVADQTTTGLLAQLQEIRASQIKAGRQPPRFCPFVEICESITADILQEWDVQYMNNNTLESNALAMVAISREVNRIFKSLTSEEEGDGVNIRNLQEFLVGEEQLPTTLSFAEAQCYVSGRSDEVLIGWSSGVGDRRSWVLNPQDKLEQRTWAPDDAFVILRHAHARTT